MRKTFIAFKWNTDIVMYNEIQQSAFPLFQIGLTTAKTKK